MVAATSAFVTRSIDSTPLSWIDTAEGVADLVRRALDAPWVAVDTESNSLHAYFERVCLVQLSLPDADFLVDPLAVDLGLLQPLLSAPAPTKIFHDAEYDILCLKRAHAISVAGLFDTMWAARVLGWPKYGLASLLDEHFGVRLNKKFQRFDWGRRPLPDDARDYARSDTHYLAGLRERQLQALDEAGLTDEAAHAFSRQAQVSPTAREFDREGYWRIKGIRDLDPGGKAVLRELFLLRDEVARELDTPPFKVADNSTLVSLARSKPKKADELRRIRRIHPKLRRRPQAILDAIGRGRAGPPPTPPARRSRGPKEIEQRLDALKSWRKTTAAGRGVEPDVILRRQTLEALAEAGPADADALAKVPELDAWERDRYGKALLRLLTGQSNR